MTADQIQAALGAFFEHHLDCTLAEAKVIKSVEADGEEFVATLRFGFPLQTYEAELRTHIQSWLAGQLGEVKVRLDISSKISSHAVQNNLTPVPGVKNIIAVASGKGGVGKSTTAVNLALALHAEGATVGILDADIYGPSQPRMLGASGRPELLVEEKRMLPKMAHGIQSMSIGYLVDEEEAMIWRGPMVTSALNQLLTETKWTDVDYLIIDLPPGTGDIQLTMSQKIPVSGAVIVTTPQDIALLDARKGLEMFKKVNVPVLGVIENMSVHICSNCGHPEHIFGEGGGEQLAADTGVDLLGALPLDMGIRSEADSGTPTVVADPEGAITAIYAQIARTTVARLSIKDRNYSNAFPKITVTNT
jgi:ATP-binding protein involved in chromosome partitioning